jgi:hypothetical protein
MGAARPAAQTLNTTYLEIYTYEWALGSMNCDQAALDEMEQLIGQYVPVP